MRPVAYIFIILNYQQFLLYIEEKIRTWYYKKSYNISNEMLMLILKKMCFYKIDRGNSSLKNYVLFYCFLQFYLLRYEYQSKYNFIKALFKMFHF